MMSNYLCSVLWHDFAEIMCMLY